MSNRLTVLAADIQAAHAAIGRASVEVAERAISAGHMLIEAKAALPHGRWDAWLLEQVATDPRAFVVRGTLTAEAREAIAANPRHQVRRRKHLKDGVAPTLAEVARRWIMVDIDGFPLRPHDDLATDPGAAIDHAVYELLPEAFHDAECWWQLSSSAGFVPGILKAHLFFWLSEPAENTHVNHVLEQHAPGVDRAPFSAAQPHYIAAPVIEGGHDPLPIRTGWRKGLDSEVVLPALRPVERGSYTSGTGGMGKMGSVTGALARLGHGEGRDGFHAPIRAACWHYSAQSVRLGERDDEAFMATSRIKERLIPRVIELPATAPAGVVAKARVVADLFGNSPGRRSAAARALLVDLEKVLAAMPGSLKAGGR